MKKYLFGILLIIVLSGCETVNPWERDYLARPEMGLNPDPMDTTYREHIFFSKEASSDAANSGGGGCGCN